MEGASLLPALGGQEMPSREFITTSECTWQKKWAIRTNSEKLILSRQPDFHGMPRVELYDLKADPHELNNIAASQPERTRSLESRLEAWIKSAGASIDDVATQVRYARMKAGLSPHEPVDLYRFRVEKYE